MELDRFTFAGISLFVLVLTILAFCYLILAIKFGGETKLSLVLIITPQCVTPFFEYGFLLFYLKYLKISTFFIYTSIAMIVINFSIWLAGMILIFNPECFSKVSNRVSASYRNYGFFSKYFLPAIWVLTFIGVAAFVNFIGPAVASILL
jgi:hypothetical protein